MASDTTRAAGARLRSGEDGEGARLQPPLPDASGGEGRGVGAAHPSDHRPPAAAAAAIALALAASAGALLQLALPCARCAAPFAGAAFAVLYASIAAALPPRLRGALGAQEAFATILAALAAVCALGTLVLQGQAEGFYVRVYGPSLSAAILRLGLDDAFHSLWFAGIAGVFAGSVVRSAARRWPPSRSDAGFHLSHLGILVALAGAASSSALAVRGRIELRAGESARDIAQRSTHRSHAAVPARVPLGFALQLDRFDVERYGSELRIGYHERAEDGWRLRASFAPEAGIEHRLPSGASFVVREAVERTDPSSFSPVLSAEAARGEGPPRRDHAAHVRVTDESGAAQDVLLVAGGPAHVTRGGAGALVLEPRPPEPRSFRSHVTVTGAGVHRSGAVAVNDPFRHGGWTFYQASYDPEDPRFSALEAVRDPGAACAFAGLALVAAGVAHALLARAWLRRPRRPREVP